MSELPPRIDIPRHWREPESDKAWLHLGESPFTPTEGVLRAIAEAGRSANRYPDTNCLALRKSLAAYAGHGVGVENLIVGNGSDELIDLAVVALTQAEQSVVTFEPSFFVFRFAARRHGRGVHQIARNPDFGLPVPACLGAALGEVNAGLSFIANPNNPTGTLTPRDELIAFIDAMPGVKVVDECYFEFCGSTVADLAIQRDDLIVFRSLSKCFGLAGLRLGYAIASETTIDRLARAAMTFPVNAIAQAAGVTALNEAPIYQERVNELIERRERYAREFESLGAEIVPTHANFILTLWPQNSDAKERLTRSGVIVSDQSKALDCGRLALRIAIGSEEEMQRTLEALK